MPPGRFWNEPILCRALKSVTLWNANASRILRQVQDAIGYLPLPVMPWIAHMLNAPVSELIQALARTPGLRSDPPLHHTIISMYR